MLFDSRTALLPSEYPQAEEYEQAIANSYWRVTEWNFSSDAHDFKIRLEPAHREVIKRALLAISQVEVAVKRFWARLGDRIPKPEYAGVGDIFAESEHRHLKAYSHLLGVLGLQAEFDHMLSQPAMRNRVRHLTSCLANTTTQPHEEWSHSLAAFCMFVENVSLFAQFLVIKSFNTATGCLKDIENVVQATQKEERIHALFGAHLTSVMRREYPEWFGETFSARLSAAAASAIRAENDVIDWMFGGGDLPFLSAKTVKEFVKRRVNLSLGLLGEKPSQPVDEELLKDVRWFDEESSVSSATDFFHKKPVGYSKHVRPATAADLF